MSIDKKSILEYMEEYGGAAEALRGFSEVVDKRSYFSVKDFEIKRKEMNLALPAAGFFPERKELVAEAIEKSIDFREKQIIGKIERLSNLDLKKLKETYEKLLYKNSFEYILRYAKELLLRDEKEFYRITYRFVLSDNMKLLKPLMLLGFEKIGKRDDEFIILLMAYLTKARSDYSYLENISKGETWHSYEYLKGHLKELSEKLDSRKGLEILSYCSAMEKYGISEEEKQIVSVLSQAVEELKSAEAQPLDRIEKVILEKLKRELEL